MTTKDEELRAILTHLELEYDLTSLSDYQVQSVFVDYAFLERFTKIVYIDAVTSVATTIKSPSTRIITLLVTL